MTGFSPRENAAVHGQWRSLLAYFLVPDTKMIKSIGK